MSHTVLLSFFSSLWIGSFSLSSVNLLHSVSTQDFRFILSRSVPVTLFRTFLLPRSVLYIFLSYSIKTTPPTLIVSSRIKRSHPYSSLSSLHWPIILLGVWSPIMSPSLKILVSNVHRIRTPWRCPENYHLLQLILLNQFSPKSKGELST